MTLAFVTNTEGNPVTPIRRISVCAAVFTSAATAFAQLDFTRSTILADGMWNNPSSIAIDSAGVIHMAYMQEFGTDSASKEIWYANNAAGTWSFQNLTNNAVREEYPCLTLDADEHVHISFHTGTDTSNKIRYTNNVSGSFFEPIDITGSGYVIVEHAVDSAGDVHFAFQNQISGSSITDVFYRMWSPSTGLGPLMNLTNTPADRELATDIAIDSNDVVHVVCRAGGIISGPIVYFNNAGGSFASVPTGVAAAEDPQIGIDGNDHITITYDVNDTLFLIESNGIGGFASPTTLTTPGAYRPAFIDKFAIDVDNRRHIAWVSNVNNEGAFVITETESGFSAPIPIEDDPATSKVGTSIAVDSAGMLAVTYQFGYVADGIVQADIHLAIARIGTCPGDLDGDSTIGLSDLAILLAHFGETGAAPEDGDLDGDGDVDLGDLATLLAVYGAACG